MINPTVASKMDSQYSYHQREVSRKAPATPPHQIFTFKAEEKTPESTGAMQDLKDEPLYWPGYASEEELASPIDNDDFSFDSIDSDIESIASIGEASFHSFTHGQQLCSRAQAVQVVSAGKAKVVSMPKIVDGEDSPRFERPITASDDRPVNFSLRRTNNRSIAHARVESIRSSPRTSGDRRPAASSPILWTDHTDFEFETRRRRPLPLDLVPRSESPREMQSVPKTSSFIRTSSVLSKSPPPLRTKNFLDYEPHPESSSRPPSTQSKRRLHRLPSALTFRSFTKTLRHPTRSSSTASNASRASTPDPVPTYLKPRVSTPATPRPAPTPTPARHIPKMVPRGANERAPPLILPPCPYEDGDEGVDGHRHEWAVLRSERRRKSLPAFAAVSSEA